MSDAQRAALDKSTLEHPPIAAFVDLVSLIEDGAPAECIRDAVGELRRHGYIVSPPPPVRPTRTTGRTGTIAPGLANATGPALPTGERRGTFEREPARGRQTPGRSVDPSPASRSARPDPGNTPLRPLLGKALLR